MNIACTSCSARYGVADEKLIGKRVRITCKRCGTVLIVDGNYNPPTVSASTSMAPSPRSSSRPAQEPKAPPPAPEPPFMVAFADGHQEEADVAQIVRFHRAGRLGNDSVVWRDGMPDWVDPWDVPDIAAAFRRMGYARPTPAPAPAPPPARQPLREAFDDEATQIHQSGPHHAAPLYEDGEDTHVVDSSSMGSPRPQRDPRVASSPVAADDEVPTHVGTPRGAATRAAAREPQRTRRVSSHPPGGAETAAEEYQRARREAKSRGTTRRSSGPAPAPPQEPVDLFARQAAGSEDDQEQPPNLGPGHELDIPRLTGARNESSVLFSLDSLLKQEQKSVRPARPPRRDESLLVDQSPSLPTGGGIAPALAAPDFTAPITSPPPRFAPPESPVVEEERTRSSRAWLYLLVLLAFGGAGAFGWKTGALRPILSKLGLSTPAPAASDSATTPAATASERIAPPAESASAAAEASASASASAPASSASAAPSTATPTKPPSTAAARPAGETATPAARPPSTGTSAGTKEPAAAAEKPDATEKPTAGEKPAATEKPPGGTEPFDAAAAKEALSGATANVANCKEMGGPTGTGRVSITFAPSGRPTSVAVTGDLAGTTVGSCIARLYRGVRVPAFSGDPVTVAKGFSVQ